MILALMRGGVLPVDDFFQRRGNKDIAFQLQPVGVLVQQLGSGEALDGSGFFPVFDGVAEQVFKQLTDLERHPPDHGNPFRQHRGA